MIVRSTCLFLILLTSCAEGQLPCGEAAVDALEKDTGRSWRAVFRDDATPSTLARDRWRAAPSRNAIPDDAESIARAFVERWPNLFGAAAAPEGLVVRDIAADGMGGARVRYGVSVGGLAVEGGDVVVALDENGEVRLAAGTFPARPRLAAQPRVGQTAAVAAAHAQVRVGAGDRTLTLEEPPALLAAVVDGELRPMWRVILVGDGLRREVHVDAATGAVAREREGMISAAAVGSGVGVNGRRRELDIFEGSDGFRLRDVTRTADAIRTYTANGRTKLPGLLVRSEDPDVWDDEGRAAGAAVDGHANAALVYDYLASLGWRSLDGDDGPIRVVVHYGDDVANAFWDGRRAVFGDGDGDTSAPFASALDIVAHELFHGVIEGAGGLVYAGEPGALNESIADVFGCLVELRRGGGNWLVGEDVRESPLRDLSDPARLGQPRHMDDYVELPVTPWTDMGGVHVNSTIPSHAAYLLVEGGTHEWSGIRVPAIGAERVEKIWMRALVIYVTPRAGFADFALATRSAAEDLYGPSSEEVDAVERAWLAVGVD